MKCPTCSNSTLVMSERQGIEIDYCPQCRGVWLDRGELDKLIVRSAPAATGSGAQPHARPAFADSDYPGDFSHSRRKKSWLSDIFD